MFFTTLLLTKINLFISIPYLNQVYDKKKKILSGDLCVLYNVMLRLYSLYQKSFSCRQPWW